MNVVRSLAVFAVASFVGLVACSSDSSNSASSSCADAKKVADDCNANQPKDGGASITINFDQSKCESSDQGKKAADCIVANKSNCDCVTKCSLTGSCS